MKTTETDLDASRPFPSCNHLFSWATKRILLSLQCMVKAAAYIRSISSSVPQNTTSIVSAPSLAKYWVPTRLWSSEFWSKRCHLHWTSSRRTHVMFSNSGQINKLLNIVLRQDILWTNAGSLKDSRRSECPGRKNDKTWRPGYEWLRGTLCSSNCIVNIFNSDSTGTPVIIKIMIREYTNETNTYSKITRTTRCLATTFKFLLWSWL